MLTKARLIPIYFPNRDQGFDDQISHLNLLLSDVAEILPPVALGSPLPDGDAVLFPQVLGDAYRMVDAIRAIPLPLLIVTSEFGTLSMWDWEIRTYLRGEVIETIAPYTLKQTRQICRALSVKRDLRRLKFVIYQDNPGEGFQPAIFKRFYWWENECTQRMFDKFGITIEKRSFKELGAEAKAIPDSEAEGVWQHWAGRLNLSHIEERQILSALKVYLALSRSLDADDSIQGLGINCLNESHFSDTTPCLAWNMLYEERGLIWGCEADTVSMLTKYLLHKSLDVPIMMTNLYPFRLGNAALRHERIPSFPPVTGDPGDYILAAHCGYFGVVPQSFASEWQMRPKVLEIVDPNSAVIDARMPEGPMTLAKIQPSFDRMSVLEGELSGYAQFPDSDCVNGAVLHIADGHQMMQRLASHHYLLMTGHNLPDIDMIASVFGITVNAQ